MTSDADRAFLLRLREMDAALARMQRELPDDVTVLAVEARRRVAAWIERVAAGGADLAHLGDDMREISAIMDALTARLLLTPWSGPPRAGPKS